MLSLKNVCYRYSKGNQDVLKSVNAEMPDGKLHAIVGPSGSGKTTLLSIMAGLDRPTSGGVLIDGEDLVKMDLDRYRRERVSMIFQAFQLFPLLSALENVCFPMVTLGVARKQAEDRARELLGAVGILNEKCNRYPANLSGGEQQRVAIARALSSGAKVILADEPTGNLDTANGDAVMEILQRLAHKQGYCVVIVTHNPEIADSADQVMRMKDGVLTVRQKNIGSPQGGGGFGQNDRRAGPAFGGNSSKKAEIEFMVSELLAGRK
ncbi:MAG: ABC transporter ATP-binding protein [Defluviitaleaceae bacterium]|nr:ABC transporter ATP-binding protein [Defluviitaleaceae bacterium]